MEPRPTNGSTPTNDVIKAMATARAMRYLKPDLVAQELIDAVLYAATRASSPGNTQGWTFIVVRDPEQRARIGKAMAPIGAGMRGGTADLDDKSEQRTRDGAAHLLATMGRAPVIIFVCARNVYPPQAPNEQWMWSAAYSASQNLIVAARSLGLGAVFTTFHMLAEGEIRDILGLPDDVYLATTIPLGWPARPFGPLTRKPLADVVREDRW